VQAPIPAEYKAVLFDLDGTLIDHVSVITRCINHAFAELGVPPVTHAQVHASVGGSIMVTMGKLGAGDQVERAIALYREEFDRIWSEDIHVMPHAEWLLAALRARGLRLAVFTNKEGDRARRILRHVGLDRWLDGTFGILDTPWRKPQPEFTAWVLAKLGADAAHACMIGDSPYDIETAASGPMPCYVVATGSHSLAELRASSAAGAYADLRELGRAVFGLDEAGQTATS
jgi:phosphoglycolate phosphatase